MKYSLILCFNLLQLFEVGQPKPLREIVGHGKTMDSSGKGKRIRRSIPEFEAVNPLYSDYESLPDQEGSADPQRAGFALTDHLSNIFRSQKSSKNNPKQSPKHASVDHVPSSLTKDINSIDGEYLRTDEQEECYKQQNIAPPAVKEVSLKRCSGVGGRNSPEIAEKQRASYIRGNLLNEKSGKFFEEKEGEKTEITSLYSHPEKIYKPRKVKHYSELKSPDLFKSNGRVYKPTDTETQFPIYDGDLDFHPDPLQGILDDKYWLDPQEQEAVIRKHMDIAANIVPSDLIISKRSSDANKETVKSIDSQSGYKQSPAVDEPCPCKQVVACGECSKGKGGKKTNMTGSFEEGISYGRKLLSIEYENNIEESRNDGAREISSVEYENVGLPINDGPNEETQIDEHIPIVTMNNHNERDSLDDNKRDVFRLENKKEDENINDNNKIHLGRKLLSINVFDESYEDIVDENEEYDDRSNPEILKGNSYNDPKINVYQYDELYPSVSAYDSNDENPTHERFQNFKHLEMAKIDSEDDQPKLYVPNKLANTLQKPLQKKSKGPPKKLPINITLEFETLQNETLKNVSNTEQTTTSEQTTVTGAFTTPGQKLASGVITTQATKLSHEINKSFKKQDYNLNHGNKGRRRHAEQDSTKNRSVALSQSSGDVGETGTKGTNVTSSKTATMTPTTSSSFSQAGNATPTVVHKKNSTDIKMGETPKNNTKSMEEGNEDAQIATNIVNSVLLESQKSSVLGHNLGLCRRNESLMKVNYGKVIPETEKVLKTVTACIMDRLKNHLAKQSCIILDPELLDFLKWMILTGESYKAYKQRLPKMKDFNLLSPGVATSCAPPLTTAPLCDPGNANTPSI